MSASHPIRDFSTFWTFYLGEHSNPTNRRLHFLGTTFALGLAICAVYFREPRLILAALVTGYLFAWIGHFVFEKNRPATFRYPLWSFVADWKMWARMLRRKL